MVRPILLWDEPGSELGIGAPQRDTPLLCPSMRVPGGGASVLLAMAVAAAPAAAANKGVPSVSSGHRPGPDALYAKPASAPQLQNAAPWEAKPILVARPQYVPGGERA